MKLYNYKVDKWLLFSIILFFIISVSTIFSAQNLIGSNDLVFKQVMWYIIGFIFIFFMMKFKNKFIIKHVWILYFNDVYVCTKCVC